MGYHSNSNSILSILTEKIESTSDSWISSTKSKQIKFCIAMVILLLLCGSVVAGVVILKSLSVKWQYWLLFVVVEIVIWVISGMLFCILAKTLVKLQKELDNANYNYEEVQRKLSELKSSVEEQLTNTQNDAQLKSVSRPSIDALSLQEIMGNEAKTVFSVNGEAFSSDYSHFIMLSPAQLSPYYVDSTPGIIKHASLVYNVRKKAICFQLDDGRILSLDSVMSYLSIDSLFIGFVSGFPVMIKSKNGCYQVVIDSIDNIYFSHYESAIESLKIFRGMLTIYRPWQYNQSDGQNKAYVIILSFALRVRFSLSIKPADKYEPVSILGSMIDDWLSAYRNGLSVDLNGILEIYQYLKSFNIDTLKAESAFNILSQCWQKILNAYHAFSKESRKAAEIYELERRHDSDMATITKLREEVEQLKADNLTIQSQNANTVMLSNYNELQARYEALLIECEKLKDAHTSPVDKQQFEGDLSSTSHANALSDAENSDNMQYYQPSYSMPEGSKFLSETSESLFTAGKTMTFSLVTRRVSRAPLWIFSPNLILPNPLFANVLDSLATEITLKRAFVFIGSPNAGKPKRILPATVEPKDDGFVLVTPGEIVY